ncbi:calcium/sodium antiporter [Neptunitalea lumnitzerae]|uniref:Sodium:calcium antiporter n=1 Tax=Neptunitalea lumnitzerae TaxID=2965509 RepID=A0ABQ5MM39_9FLAO|nr:calcium/sodium antiporter [Neptunitalea sp. Y10]GLB50022.1 sodium:calcium antiporter [Neptunitalea sp. Y10]
MFLNIFFLLAGFTFLILGGNWLLKAAVALSLRLQIPKIIIGMTVVSLATSAPELIVSVNAALKGTPILAMGNVIGSNIANLGLVLSITILLGRIDVEKDFYQINWPVLMVSSLVLFGVIYFDGILSSYEGLIMVLLLIFFLVYLVRFQKPAVVDEAPEDDMPLPVTKTVLYLIVGGVGLWGGSELLIKGAVALAEDFNVSQKIIALTVIAIGTSIPELAASVTAVLKKEKAISLGNLLGSNIFNILAVLGITSTITPIQVGKEFNDDLFWMIGISALLLPLVFFPKNMRLSFLEGIVLLIVYGLFVYFTVLS